MWVLKLGRCNYTTEGALLQRLQFKVSPSSLVYRTRKILNNISSLEIQAYVRVQVTKYSSERHYFPNWNFMLKTRTILIVSCRPGISLLCSSSSYKIFNEKNIIHFFAGIRHFSTCNYPRVYTLFRPLDMHTLSNRCCHTPLFLMFFYT